MADQFDLLMKSIADEADAKLDYSAMREAVLQKAAAQKRKRARTLRYGAMAASFVVLLGAGALFLTAQGGFGFDSAANEAAPQAADFLAAPGSNGAFDDALEGASLSSGPEESEQAPAPIPAGSVQNSSDGSASYAAHAECEEDLPASVSGAYPAATKAPEKDLSSAGSAAEPSGGVVHTPGELEALYADTADSTRAALPAAGWLYAPVAAPHGYRLLEITADVGGIAYRYNKAAAKVHDDEYTLFIPAASLSGTLPPLDGAGMYVPAEEAISTESGFLAWPLGDGSATLTPAAGCSLSLEELKAYCALRLTELGG